MAFSPTRSLFPVAALFVLGVAFFAQPARAGSVEKVPQDANKQLNEEFDKSIYPILEINCIGCHSGSSPSAGLDLGALESTAQVAAEPKKYEKVIQMLRSQVMPPPDSGAPTLAEREKVVSWIQRALSQNCVLDGPGKVTIRRLNRNEYNNTVNDLLGIDMDLSKDFPSDDVGYGFDNIGDVLTLTPLHLEMYLKAARNAVDRAIYVAKPKLREANLEKVKIPDSARVTNEGGIFFFANGKFTTDFKNLDPGEYEITISASETYAGFVHAQMELTLNGVRFQTFEISKTTLSNYKLPFTSKGGDLTVGIAFINDYYEPNNPDPAKRDRNLLVSAISIEGPQGGTVTLPDSHRKLLTAVPTTTLSHQAAARQVLENFVGKAYRRPATADEINRLMNIYNMVRENKDSYEEAIKVCVQAVLVNPNFLFRVELDNRATAKARDLNGYELASRLSYFLWNSLPDQTLLDLAAKGELTKPSVLEAQVTRMLKDTKSVRFTADFSTQWLQTRRLVDASPDNKLFPGFTPDLRKDMEQEVEEYFRDMLANNRVLPEFLDSKFTFLNARLARHYGIPGDFGTQFRRVDVSSYNRGGILGMGAILTVTSNPNRTSPVKRGKFIMEEILGSPPPPPPPNVGVLDEDTSAIAVKTMRERLEKHRRDPNCASCHQPLDAFGFSLENYNPVGQWRTQDGNFPVDNKGELPCNQTINGVDDLKTYLLKRENDFTRSLTEKLLTYALGRGLTSTDSCMIEAIIPKVKKRGNHLSALITEIVLSDSFRKRTVTGTTQ
ncbi:MAG: DUF1592 domain-containing protein [Fimbriimonadaceae bacterium]|nr:MAG: DUF1592 domain-containing protein [Fimbriimonadaceae bacterium]